MGSEVTGKRRFCVSRGKPHCASGHESNSVTAQRAATLSMKSIPVSHRLLA